jgi:hypothetical protein
MRGVARLHYLCGFGLSLDGMLVTSAPVGWQGSRGLALVNALFQIMVRFAVAPPVRSPCAGSRSPALVNYLIAAVTPPPAPNAEIGIVVSSTMFQPVAWMIR